MCQDDHCWGHDVLPLDLHIHVPDPERPNEDWIVTVKGARRLMQLRLPESNDAKD